MEDLSVEARHHDLIVTMPLNGHRERNAPMLVALGPLRYGLDAERLAFLARAWKAAYAKAKGFGWF